MTDLVARVHFLEKQVEFLLPFFVKHQEHCAIIIQRWWRRRHTFSSQNQNTRFLRGKNPLVLKDIDEDIYTILPFSPRSRIVCQTPPLDMTVSEEVIIEMENYEIKTPFDDDDNTTTSSYLGSLSSRSSSLNNEDEFCSQV